ncbi:Hsp20/alpha crystallin family protein [Haloplanus sp.]|uniref:Hsp20/alpha crystallin family protein n=1 Tax=Haloplanus sp. TaxID=1961696 RepID=UPI002637F9CC|nr:Hsp20/alpha crystallin family protein [Haloplanus sp.]
MSQLGTAADTHSVESLSQERNGLLRLASNVGAQAARAAIEAASSGVTQSTQQDALTGQTRPQAQAAQLAQAQLSNQAQAQQQLSAPGQQGYQKQQAQQGHAASPSFSQQATSPQLTAFQQQASQAEAQQQHSPAVDVIESNEEVRIFADLPGVDSDSIEIQASDSTISLSAERIESQQEDQLASPVMAERGKVMQRQVQLPAQCDVDEASATWDKGVVTITLPKVESESTKRIGVQ